MGEVEVVRSAKEEFGEKIKAGSCGNTAIPAAGFAGRKLLTGDDLELDLDVGGASVHVPPEIEQDGRAATEEETFGVLCGFDRVVTKEGGVVDNQEVPFKFEININST